MANFHFDSISLLRKVTLDLRLYKGWVYKTAISAVASFLAPSTWRRRMFLTGSVRLELRCGVFTRMVCFVYLLCSLMQWELHWGAQESLPSLCLCISWSCCPSCGWWNHSKQPAIKQHKAKRQKWGNISSCGHTRERKETGRMHSLFIFKPWPWDQVQGRPPLPAD